MRLVRASVFLTGWLQLAGWGLAASPDLVSVNTAGNPGQADSGSVRGGAEMRAAAVLDDGTVYFLSLAPLTPADTNVVADYYRRNGTDTTTVVDSPTVFASGHCFWGGTDATGTTFYVFRQLPDQSQLDLQFGTLVTKTSLGVHSLIRAADFAGGGGYAVYEQDVSGVRHLFLHDLTAVPKTETQVTSGNNGDSRDPAISANGTRIVFSSNGSSVVPNDVNGVADVFLYDRTSGGFTLISQRLSNLANADAMTPDISADGQVICFVSADGSFVPGDTNARRDVFVHRDGALQRCSIGSDGTQADEDSGSPQLNADGRFVVFVSRASNLVPGLANGRSQVFLYDRDVGLIEALSLNAVGTPADADCFVPGISPGGRYVTFVSKATNLGNGVNGNWYQVYRADRGQYYANHPPVVQGLALAAAQGEIIQFSPTATDADGEVLQFVPVGLPTRGTLTAADGAVLHQGQAYGAASLPWRFVPADGGIFADSFTFRATDGKTMSSVATAQVRMVDPHLGTVTRVSVATDGTQGTQDSYLPYPGLGLSADGSLVAFCSQATLDPLDRDGGSADIYLRTTVVGSTSLMSVALADSKNAYRCALSGDGRWVVYYAEDGNALILQALAGGVGQTVATVSSYLSNSGPGISDDGTRIVYEKDGQVWLFERKTSTTVKASVNAQGEAADASCGDVAISADGKVVAFSSSAANLAGTNPDGTRSVYLRLLDDSLTVLVSATPAGQRVANALKPALSETGRYVAFLADDGTVGDGIGTVYVKNVGTGALRPVAVDAANPAIAADGRFACYTKTGTTGKSQLYRTDLAAARGAVQLVSNAAGQEGDGNSFRAVLSANGRLVAFASQATNLVAGDTNGKCDIFLNDFGIPPNGLPVPLPVDTSTDEDTPLTDVALAYTDPEDNDVRTEIVTGPAHAVQFAVHTLRPGQATVTFAYVPSANYNGQDSFTYRCGDAEGWSAPVTVTITVSPVNDPPLWIGMPVLWRTQPGEEFRLDLSRFVDDPDTRDPVPDVLRFSLLQGAPEARLEDSVLVLSASAVAGPAATTIRVGVADRDEGPVIEFGADLGVHVRPPVDIPLAPGWNLLSVPMATEPASPALLLAGPPGSGAGSLYLGHVWYWDAGAARYGSAETLEPGRAYWVYCPAAAVVSMQVAWLPSVDPAVELVRGWNLLGPVGFGDIATPTWVATGTPIPGESIWQWDGTGFVHPEPNVIRRGEGCWVYSRTAQAVNLELGPAE